jgi:hypothetical protein
LETPEGMVQINGISPQQPPRGRRRRERGGDTSQLLFVDEPDPREIAEAALAAAREKVAAAEAAAAETAERAERASLVAESTGLSARSVRQAAEEALAAAEKAEAELLEAREIARNYAAEARAASDQLAAARRELTRAETAAGNRVSAWIEYPQNRTEPAAEAAPEPDLAVSEDPPPQPAAVRKRKVQVPKGYRILKRLSEDETGVLCLAHQVAMDRPVQLRILHEDRCTDMSLVRAFLEEARTAGKFNHPNLIRVHAAGKAGRQYFYATEHFDGQNLQQAIASAGRLDPRAACEVVRGLASGLEQWERHGMVHGGLNPERAVRTTSGDYKLMGLGLVSRGIDLMAELTPLELCYVAPELVLGDSTDSRADIYSLGALLYFALTGSAPHLADNRGDVIRASREDSTALLRSLRGAPKSVASVVVRAMQPEPARRYELIPELISALEGGISGSRAIAAASERLKGSSRRRRR